MCQQVFSPWNSNMKYAEFCKSTHLPLCIPSIKTWIGQMREGKKKKPEDCAEIFIGSFLLSGLTHRGWATEYNFLLV